MTSAWSVGMLNVHHMKSTEKPAAFVGTMKQLMPSARPSSPEVRAKIMSCVAVCMPLLKRFLPLITQSSPSRTAFVSSHVASEPWFGSVSPKATRVLPVNMPSRNSFFCSSLPKRSHIMIVGKLPTIDDSFCRSLCRPSPFAARCSRMIAIARFVPSRPP